MSSHVIEPHLQECPALPPLQRLGEEREAGLWITSLPWPEGARPPHGLRMGGATASVLALGQSPSGGPRRLLCMGAVTGGPKAPAQLTLEAARGAHTPVLPEASLDKIDESTEGIYYRERHRLTISWNGRRIGVALGLRRGEAFHWWEACRLVETGESAGCRVIRVGGCIAAEEMPPTMPPGQTGYNHPFLHRHNWLNGELYARLHANGGVELELHHINGRMVDDGADLKVVPVVAFFPPEGVPLQGPSELPWTGATHRCELHGVAFEFTQSAPLATESAPGRLHWEEDRWIWQPYQGAELYGGECPRERTGDPFICHAEEGKFLRGMARSLPFSFSLSACSPGVVRYLAPRSWYEACGEVPLPVELEPGDRTVERAFEWLAQRTLEGGFEDGALPRHPHRPMMEKGRLRFEPGWEGEVPYALFLYAWAKGDPRAYDLAQRSARYFSDVAIDHSRHLVRMHGYPPPAVSLPMNRVQGTVALYLETGDPFYRMSAEAVVTNAHWQQMRSWPRLAVGRDACYLRSAILLHRVLGEDFYRRIALEGGESVVASQRPNGSFGDQGGGTGLHQWGGYITKPWMGLLAVNPLVDYLELYPDTPSFSRAVVAFACWLMEERQVRDGRLTWCYQHDFKGERLFYETAFQRWITLPSEGAGWHHETLARVMRYATAVTGDPAFVQAWRESRRPDASFSLDQGAAAALQFIL